MGPIEINGVGSSAPPAAAGGIGSLLGSAPVVGGLVSGGLGLLGGLMSNRANAKAAREQMQFQERMRATQYQTAVADLKQAGLNPMLAYTQGGAGTPQGAAAKSENVAAPAVSSALAAATAVQNLEQTSAQTSLIRAQVDNANAERARILADTDLKKAAEALTTWEGFSAKFRQIWERETLPQRVMGEHARQRASELDLPRAESEAKFYRTAGDIAPFIGPLKNLVDVFTGVGKLGSMFEGKASPSVRIPPYLRR